MPSFEFLPMSDIIFNLDTCFYILFLRYTLKTTDFTLYSIRVYINKPIDHSSQITTMEFG